MEPLLSGGASSTQINKQPQGPGLRRNVSSSCSLAGGINSQEQKTALTKTQRTLIIALSISLTFLIIETIGGILSHSLAILTDAAHLLSDVAGFGVSLFAASWATKAAKDHFSFGYHRIEILGSLANVLSVWLVTGILIVEAVHRVQHPSAVDGKLMFVLAIVGVAVNLLLAWLLGGHHHHNHGGSAHSSHDDTQHNHDHDMESPAAAAAAQLDTNNTLQPSSTPTNHNHNDKHIHSDLNIKGALIHVIGDLVQSIGVAIAGALIWWHNDDPRWYIADPICTFLFAALVLWTTGSVLREITDVLMEKVPRHINISAVARDLRNIDGVKDVHDLHVWLLKPSIPLLCAHVEMNENGDATDVLYDINVYCRRLGIAHSTVQLLVNGSACPCDAARLGLDCASGEGGGH